MVDRSGSCFRDCDGDDFKGSVSPPATRGTNTYAHWEGQRTPSGQHTFRRSTRPNVAPPPAGALRSAAQPPSCPGCAGKETNRNPFDGLNDLVHGATILAKWYVGNPGESWLDRLALIPGPGVVGKGIKGGKAGIDLLKRSDKTAGAAKGGGRLWAPREVVGRRVYQRDDLINPMRTNARGETSLKLMQRGRAPIGPDGRPLQLHHTIQKEPGSVAEITQNLHQRGARQLHINPSNTLPSGIDRAVFRRWKAEYWMRRAGDFGR
jgi:hypothetical protein